MTKKQTIKAIKKILSTEGCFSICELMLSGIITESISVGTLGKFIGLAEYFTEDYVEINVYDPSSYSSDEVDTYEEKYENLNNEVLAHILYLCEQFEVDNIKTEKRISN